MNMSEQFLLDIGLSDNDIKIVRKIKKSPSMDQEYLLWYYGLPREIIDHKWNRILGRGKFGELWDYCVIHKKSEIVDT